MPGVLRIFTGEDFAAVGGHPLRLAGDRPLRPADAEPKHPVLAEGKVRHVGDPIAAVVAETLAQARDAAEAIEVEIEELPAVVDMRAALEPGAPKVHEDLASNLCYDWGFIEDNRDAVDEAIKRRAPRDDAGARQQPAGGEPDGAAGGDGRVRRGGRADTLYTTSQNPHVIRLLMGAFVLGIPEHKLRVVAPDVGGGFGSKIYHYAEEAFVTFAAQALGRPVKWTSIAVGGVHVRRARARPCDQDRAGAGQGRQVPGDPHRRRWPTWGRTSRPSRRRSRPTCTAR